MLFEVAVAGLGYLSTSWALLSRSCIITGSINLLPHIHAHTNYIWNFTVLASEQTLAFLFYEQDHAWDSLDLSFRPGEMQFLPSNKQVNSKVNCSYAAMTDISANTDSHDGSTVISTDHTVLECGEWSLVWPACKSHICSDKCVRIISADVLRLISLTGNRVWWRSVHLWWLVAFKNSGTQMSLRLGFYTVYLKTYVGHARLQFSLKPGRPRQFESQLSTSVTSF